MESPDVKEDIVRVDRAVATEDDPEDELVLTELCIADSVAVCTNAESIEDTMLLESAFGSLYIVIS